MYLGYSGNCRTNGTEGSVCISNVSFINARTVLLGREKLSLADRCLHFKGCVCLVKVCVLGEGVCAW